MPSGCARQSRATPKVTAIHGVADTQHGELAIPGRTTLDLNLTFQKGFRPDLDEIAAIAEARGYRVLRESVTIAFADNQPVWRIAAVSLKRSRAVSPALLAHELSSFHGMAKFVITPVRN